MSYSILACVADDSLPDAQKREQCDFQSIRMQRARRASIDAANFGFHGSRFAERG